MSTQQLLLIAAAALGIFWMLGAYNRLLVLLEHRSDLVAAEDLAPHVHATATAAVPAR